MTSLNRAQHFFFWHGNVVKVHSFRYSNAKGSSHVASAEFVKYMNDLESVTTMAPIDPSIEKFPYCIVWTPIPCITWILPFIGEYILYIYRMYPSFCSDLFLKSSHQDILVSEIATALFMTLQVHITLALVV